jgi:hypothetical protein
MKIQHNKPYIVYNYTITLVSSHYNIICNVCKKPFSTTIVYLSQDTVAEITRYVDSIHKQDRFRVLPCNCYLLEEIAPEIK